MTDASESATIDDPVRIAIFNAGEYDAHLIVNYILDDLQQEQQLGSDIKRGEHRSVFMPTTATYIRIRIVKMTAKNEFITDEQITELNGTTGFCYLLAHTKSHPVYGLCPSTYADMVLAWGS